MVAHTTLVEISSKGDIVSWLIGNSVVVISHLLRLLLNISNTAVVIAAFILVFTRPPLLVEAGKYG